VDAGLSLNARSRSMPDNGKGKLGASSALALGAAMPPCSSSGGRACAAGARPWRTRRSAEEAGKRHLLFGSRSCLAARRRVVKLPPEPLRLPALPRAHAQPLALYGGLLALLGRMSRAPPTSRSRRRAGTPRRAGRGFVATRWSHVRHEGAGRGRRRTRCPRAQCLRQVSAHLSNTAKDGRLRRLSERLSRGTQ
jgi:hypothetical protein